MATEVDDDFYVEDRPVLLRRNQPRISYWDDLIFTIRRVGPYSLFTVTVGFAFLACVLLEENETLRQICRHLATAALLCPLVLFTYEYRRMMKAVRETRGDDGAAGDAAEDWPIRKRVAHILREVGLYCAAGVFTALVLWILVVIVQPATHTAEILNHIAGAFFVAAIVIFGYEWGSETKRAAGLAVSLVYAVRSMIHTMETHVVRVLEASSRNALANAMTDLIGPDGKELSAQLESFATSLRQLGTHRDWASRGYLAFVWKYHETLTDNVSKLAAFSAGGRTDDFQMRFPRAQTIADAMVSGTMRELAERGGSYYALSDCATWQQLVSFRESQKSEQHAKVKIQRIFVLGKEADRELPIGKVAEILVEHYDDARNSSGTYDLRITDTTENVLVKMPSLNEAQHFGIFSPDKQTPIAFSVHDKSMSEFRVRAASDVMLSEFKNVWDELSREQAPDAGDPLRLERIVRDYLLAYSIRRMPERSRYRGASRITTWRDDAFKRFMAATEKSMNENDIKVVRLLLVEEIDIKLVDTVVPLLQRHSELAQRTNGRYQWRVCKTGDWSPEVMKEISFGLFDDDSTTLVGDVSLEVRPFVKTIDRYNYSRLSASFEKVWDSAKSTRESIAKVFGTQAEDVLSKLTVASD